MTETEEMMQSMGVRLTDLRNKLGLSQTDVESRIKIKQQTISKLETGFHKKIPFLDSAFRLARFYRVSREYLLFGSDPMPPETQRLLKAWETAPHDLKMKIMLMLWPEP